MRLSAGLVLVPASRLPAGDRGRLADGEEGFLARLASASTPAVPLRSCLVDLVDGFRTPRTIVDAVVEFSDARGLDAGETLDAVFPLLERMLRAGLLRRTGTVRPASSESFVAEVLSACTPGAGAAWARAPEASVANGAAGVAYGLYHMARARGEAALLEPARRWARHAWEARGDAAVSHDAAPGSGAATTAGVTPYHALSGVHAVRALVAHGRGDAAARDAAVAGFVDEVRRPCAALDLRLGQAGGLLGAALLVSALGREASGDLAAAGREKAQLLVRRLAGLAPIAADRAIGYLGMAHGWGGLLYALLVWSEVTGDPPPRWAQRRLAELAALGERCGRGTRWRRRADSPEPPRYFPSWCNGAAGLVHLWALAHRVYGGQRWLELAGESAWNAWEEGDPSTAHLCCGLTGRAYGLLSCYKATGDGAWLARARRLAEAAVRAAREGHGGAVHSLFRGRLGTAVLIVDLERPAAASMPFFEP